MNIYRYESYRQVLVQRVKERQKDDRSVNYQNLAEAIRVPKSYISKVIHKKADLNQDQLFLTSKYLGFSPGEHDYFDLLLQREKCALAERRIEIEQKIAGIQKEFLETQRHIKAASSFDYAEDLTDYYRDARMQITHVCLSLPKYKKSLKALAQDLGISLTRVTRIVDRLEQLGIVERKNGRIVVKVQSIHLPQKAEIYENWRNQVRLLSLQKMQSLEKDDQYSFSVAFSAKRDFQKQIKERFFLFLQDMEKEVVSAECEQVFQMNFDVHAWV